MATLMNCSGGVWFCQNDCLWNSELKKAEVVYCLLCTNTKACRGIYSLMWVAIFFAKSTEHLIVRL